MVSGIVFVLILSILIIAHEFGHFIAAKRSGVRVEKFAIGFGPPLLRIKGKETAFMICAFPLGGYVKLAGDTRSEVKGKPDEFLTKSPGIKMRIVFAGPLFNYVMAFLLFWIIAMIGLPQAKTIVGEVMIGYPAQEAGIQAGDRILSVNGNEVNNWAQMTEEIRRTRGDVELIVERGKQAFPLILSLQEKEGKDIFGRKQMIPVIGIMPSSEVDIVRHNFFSAFLQGAKSLFSLTFLILKGFAFMIMGILPAREAVAGPLGIYYITSQAVRIGIVAILNLMAVLNVSLCIVNLFPLPVLDGGHLLFFTIEKIRKKALSERVEEFAMRFGFVLIGLMVVFVFYNDVIRFGSKLWGEGKHSNAVETGQEINR